MRLRLGPVLGFAALALWACDRGSPTEIPRPVSLAGTPDSVALIPGDTARMSVRVLDQHGAAIAGVQVVYASGQPSVATVTPAGLITAISPGRAEIVAGYASTRTVIPVLVRPDPRDAPTLLDVRADSVRLGLKTTSDTGTVAFTVRDGYGRDLCGHVSLAVRFDRAVLQADARGDSAGACVLHLAALGPGDTWVVARAGQASDSVRVSVIPAEYVFTHTTPYALAYRAGIEVHFAVSVADRLGNPARGVPVSISASGGTGAPPVVLIDSEGFADATWLPPQDIHDMAQTVHIAIALPNGFSMAWDTTVQVFPSQIPATIRFQVFDSAGSAVVRDTFTAVGDHVSLTATYYDAAGFPIQAAPNLVAEPVPQRDLHFPTDWSFQTSYGYGEMPSPPFRQNYPYAYTVAGLYDTQAELVKVTNRLGTLYVRFPGHHP